MKYDVDEAARLWNDNGYTQLDLAKHFDVTRNTIAGMINRNRDKFIRRTDENGNHIMPSSSQLHHNRTQTGNQRRKAFHAAKVKEAAETRPAVVVELIPPSLPASQYDMRRMRYAKDLLGLNAGDCKWPLTDRVPHMFCCAEAVFGSSYCEHHRVRSKGVGTASERSAAKDLKRMARKA